MVSACLLVRTEKGKFDSVAETLKQFKVVERAFSTFGRYDVVADLEAEDVDALSSMVLRIGQLSGVVFTETLVETQV